MSKSKKKYTGKKIIKKKGTRNYTRKKKNNTNDLKKIIKAQKGGANSFGQRHKWSPYSLGLLKSRQTTDAGGDADAGGGGDADGGGPPLTKF